MTDHMNRLWFECYYASGPEGKILINEIKMDREHCFNWSGLIAILHARTKISRVVIHEEFLKWRKIFDESKTPKI